MTTRQAKGAGAAVPGPGTAARGPDRSGTASCCGRPPGPSRSRSSCCRARYGRRSRRVSPCANWRYGGRPGDRADRRADRPTGAAAGAVLRGTGSQWERAAPARPRVRRRRAARGGGRGRGRARDPGRGAAAGRGRGDPRPPGAASRGRPGRRAAGRRPPACDDGRRAAPLRRGRTRPGWTRRAPRRRRDDRLHRGDRRLRRRVLDAAAGAARVAAGALRVRGRRARRAADRRPDRRRPTLRPRPAAGQRAARPAARPAPRPLLPPGRRVARAGTGAARPARSGAGERVAPLLGRWQARARRGLLAGLAYTGRLRGAGWRVRAATALPAALGLATLRVLEAAPLAARLDPDEVLRVPRAEVRLILARTAVLAVHPRWIARAARPPRG